MPFAYPPQYVCPAARPFTTAVFTRLRVTFRFRGNPIEWPVEGYLQTFTLWTHSSGIMYKGDVQGMLFENAGHLLLQKPQWRTAPSRVHVTSPSFW